MKTQDAIDLLRPLVRPEDATWADVGAGDGTFTRALATLLGPSGTVYAFDRDPSAVRSLGALAAARRPGDAAVIAARADLLALPHLPPLDGVLLGNVLHYVAHEAQASALLRVVSLLAPRGRVAVIEYDNRAPSRWVPFPVSRQRLADLARAAGLNAPIVTATRQSAFGGVLYVAQLGRPAL